MDHERFSPRARRAAARPARSADPGRRFGFSYEEAAEICECAVGTIKSRVSRARTRLARNPGLEAGRDLWGRSACRRASSPARSPDFGPTLSDCCLEDADSVRLCCRRTGGLAEEGERTGRIAGPSSATLPFQNSSRAPGISAMNVSAPPKFGMGASPRRIEDGSLIRGEGRYTTDVTPAGHAHRLCAPLDRRACADQGRRPFGGARGARRPSRLDRAPM